MKENSMAGMSRFRNRAQNRRGMALIVVVAILAALLTMGAVFDLLMRMERRSSLNLSASEEARVDADNLLDAAIQVLDAHRGDYDALNAATAWWNMQNNNPDLTIIDLDSRLNVNTMGRQAERLGWELFNMQRVGSADSWMSRTIAAALNDAGLLNVGHRDQFAEMLAGMIAASRYGADGAPGDDSSGIYYGDLENRLGIEWEHWNPSGMGHDSGTGYPATNPVGVQDGIPSAIRGPDGTAYTEHHVNYVLADAILDTHYNPEAPVGDDQPFSTFWQVVPIMDKAIEDFDTANGTDYYNTIRKQIIETLELHMCVHSHTQSPGSIDLNAAVPERLRIRTVTDTTVNFYDQDTPFAQGSYAGRIIYVIEGQGVGQWRIIADNDGGSVFLADAWAPAPARPVANSICIIVEDWSPYDNPYNKLYTALGLRQWAEAGPNVPLKREQAAKLLANIIDFKDANDIPTRIDIDATGMARGPGWNTGGGITVWGAEGLHFTEFMGSLTRITPAGTECYHDGRGSPANPPDGRGWDWAGGRWIQVDNQNRRGRWRFTNLKNGWYAMKVYGANGQTLQVSFGGSDHNVPINLGPENGLYYGYFRDNVSDLVAVQVDTGNLEIDIQGGRDSIFHTIQLLPQYIEITNIAKQSPARSTSHAINIASNWTLNVGTVGSPGSFTMPAVAPFNQVPAVSPDGNFPINYGQYIIAISRNAYQQQWGNVNTPGVVLFALGDYGANRAAKDQNANWLVNNLTGGNLMMELRAPVWGLIAGGEIDGATGLSPLEYIGHQKTDVLGTEWQPYGNYASSASTSRLIGSQNYGITVSVVMDSGQAIGGNPAQLRVDPNIHTWYNNQWAGDTVILTGGTGAGQTRVINQNQSDFLTVVTNFSPAPDATTLFEIRRSFSTRTWLNERYTEIWSTPGAVFKTPEVFSGEGYIFPLVLNRPYHSRGWVGLVPSGTRWRSIDPPAAPAFNRDGPEDLLGLIMSRSRTSGNYARLNINTAGEAVLKGVFDDSLAQWFVQTRQNNGPWQSWDALLNEMDLQDYFMTASDYAGAGTYADDYPFSPDMREELFRRFGDLIDIRSSAFLVRASGADRAG